MEGVRILFQVCLSNGAQLRVSMSTKMHAASDGGGGRQTWDVELELGRKVGEEEDVGCEGRARARGLGVAALVGGGGEQVAKPGGGGACGGGLERRGWLEAMESQGEGIWTA